MIDDHKMVRNISANLRRLLDERGWSQARLSQESGEKPMTISNLLNGKYVPGIGSLARVADALSTTVDYLIAEHSEEFSRTA